jgi:trehalose-phosphatase
VIHFVLSRALSTVKGVLVEDKGLSLSVHYRMVDAERVQEVEDIVKKTIGQAQAAGKAKLTSGKKVHEIRPGVDWNKGKAVRLLMKRYGRGGRRSGLLPIYLGDDSTDEDAFKVIEAYRKGISVLVGGPSRQSAARYYLKSPQEVGQFLETMANADGLCRKSPAASASDLPAYPGSDDPRLRTYAG